MVEIRLKQCCYKCNFPDIQSENRKLGFVFDDSITINSTVYCTHEKVCKQYLESEDEQ